MMGKREQDLNSQALSTLIDNEKKGKVERFKYLNAYVRKGQIVFVGSSLMEQFPIYEFLQDFDLPYTIYNRGIGGYTTKEMLQAMDVCIYDLEPHAVFINIGTNDLNEPDCSLAELSENYEKIIKGIKSHLTDTKIYMLAYYPVNSKVADSPYLKEIFRSRTNEKIRQANNEIKKLAEAYGVVFLDLNDAIVDESGNLKKEITVEGMHMYANGYRLILDKLLPVLEDLGRET